LTTSTFSDRLLAWYDHHGRKDLPWQKNASAYHIWLSEVMLQQTQVTTVIPYYQRFINHFPDINSLAEAHIDEVLSLWSGLGYYARGRNLHKAAIQMQQKHNAQVPEDYLSLLNLPGIGRSTAGAIMSLAFHQRYPILDGNVKRVLARYDAIDRWPGEKQAENAMWQRAEQLLPAERIANYIQAQMDLGATLCTRSRPDCLQCPLQTDCQAYASGDPMQYPVRKAKKRQPSRQTNWFVYINQDKLILLEQRPQNGIWGGLWSFPEGETVEAADINLPVKNTVFQSSPPEIKHVFSHFKLSIQPYIFTADSIDMVTENKQHIWVKIDQALTLGLPAPVKQLIEFLSSTERML